MKFQFSMLLCSLIFSCAVVTQSNAWPSPDYQEFEQEENEDVMDTQEFEDKESITDILAEIMYNGMPDAEESDYDDHDNDDDDDSLEALAAEETEKCPSGYKGKKSPFPKCQLRIKVINAINLQDKDKKGYSDPYVRITAFGLTKYLDTVYKTLKTTAIKNNLSPKWDQVLDFGVQRWTHFDIQVFDKEYKKILWIFTKPDEELSADKSYSLRTIGKGTQDMKTYKGGHLYFELV